MSYEDRQFLGREILDFLSQHGKRDASDSKEWNSPDGGHMEAAARSLLKDERPMVPFSEFGSGGYRPLSGKGFKAAKLWHDSLVQRIAELGE